MPAPLLDREEYIEQAYFFRTYAERLRDNTPAQEILGSLHEEILSTTKLPLAIEFLTAEILHKGRMGEGMRRLPHYFTPFQAFVMSKAEEDRSRFDLSIALMILEREAEYRSDEPAQAGLFIYQFECVARNRLGYEAGLQALAEDPFYDENWRDWILRIGRQLGVIDFADLLYRRSEHAVNEYRRETRNPDFQPSKPILFGVQEGRIAKANRNKDPLYMFAALQRQLSYPAVPRLKPKAETFTIHPVLDQRLQQLEKRMQLLEMELKGGIDLTQFYVKPDESQEE